MTDTRKLFREELMMRQDKVRQELNSQEASLRHALRDAVVDDVMRLFPFVFFPSSLSKGSYSKVYFST